MNWILIIIQKRHTEAFLPHFEGKCVRTWQAIPIHWQSSRKTQSRRITSRPLSWLAELPACGYKWQPRSFSYLLWHFARGERYRWKTCRNRTIRICAAVGSVEIEGGLYFQCSAQSTERRHRNSVERAGRTIVRICENQIKTQLCFDAQMNIM